MKQQRKKVTRHLYEVSWQTSSGDWSRYFYAVFRCRLKGKDRSIPLGADLSAAKDQVKRIEAKNVDRYDFDLDKQRVQAKPHDGKSEPFMFAEWCEQYPDVDDVKACRSLTDKLTIIRLHLRPFFGACSLTEFKREGLTRYIRHRSDQTLIRNKKGQSTKKVSRGTISNELSLLRHILRVASREGYLVTVPSFEGLIVRTGWTGREITEGEEEKLLPIFSPWMQRLWIFGKETCLSQGDLLRLTDDMIDERQGTITPEGGRKKTNVDQVSPLTDRARAILEEIRAEKWSGVIVPNLHGLVFTLNDGTRITKGHIHAQVKKALRETGIRKFTFHNLRHTALTEWSRMGIHVDVAMKASGHSSTQMHQRYVKLQDADVANAFGTSKIDKRIDKQKRVGHHK